jgi:hypothetical protein
MPHVLAEYPDFFALALVLLLTGEARGRVNDGRGWAWEALKGNEGRKGSWEGKSLPHRGRKKGKQAWRKDFVLRILNNFLPQDCWF